ncbi:uncharacterized protein LOC115879762 [Sitophilus oryzae]|uniref:Uncharacterized protein LOC115879762 n=1 Tax=Sitophilus oryzae TaxID=7048 RepID=A0A6J2XPN1_SITOR|nr:uncharacterized protein LOC115879762 [Sitophilus oryzae]
MGNLFVFGNTAAMAWELPSTPIFLDKKYLKKEEENMETTTTEKPIEYVEYPEDAAQYGLQSWHAPLLSHDSLSPPQSTGWQSKISLEPEFEPMQINRAPVNSYFNPFDEYVQPSWGKSFPDERRRYEDSQRRGPDNIWTSFENRRFPIQRKPIMDRDNMQFRKSVFHHVHRRSRRELYTKIEKFLDALTKNGKICILKAICQVTKSEGKGTMVQEIIKAIFKVKPHDLYPDEDHYDQAANLNHNCDELYPECEGHVLSNLFKNVGK